MAIQNSFAIITPSNSFLDTIPNRRRFSSEESFSLVLPFEDDPRYSLSVPINGFAVKTNVWDTLKLLFSKLRRRKRSQILPITISSRKHSKTLS